MYFCASGGPSSADIADKFQGDGERIDSYLATSLTHIFVQEQPENEPLPEPATVSASRDCTSEEDRIMDSETNSKAAVRGSIHILPYL